MSSSWTNGSIARTVLIVVHTMTAMNRLADILDVFDSDRRVQLFFTFPNVSPVTGDIERSLEAAGALLVPWHEVLVTEYDLAISVHHSGNLQLINAPLALLSHGIGYTKLRKPETGNRKPETRNQKSMGSVPAGCAVTARCSPKR